MVCRVALSTDRRTTVALMMFPDPSFVRRVRAGDAIVGTISTEKIDGPVTRVIENLVSSLQALAHSSNPPIFPDSESGIEGETGPVTLPSTCSPGLLGPELSPNTICITASVLFCPRSPHSWRSEDALPIDSSPSVTKVNARVGSGVGLPPPLAGGFTTDAGAVGV